MKNHYRNDDLLDFGIERNELNIDEFNAPVWKRFIHVIIDSFIFFWIGIIGIVIAFPNYESDYATDREMLFFFFIFFACWFAFEYAFGRTPGKFLTRTKVVMNDGRKPTVASIFIRTITRIIPFSFITFLGIKKLTIHDRASKTRVVSIKYKYVLYLK